MKALILYSTIYGHNLEMSQFIHQSLLPYADWMQIDNFDFTTLADYDLLVLCPCTYGEGYLQPRDEAFQNFLKKSRLPRLKYLIVAAGDRDFGPSDFANAANIFQFRLKAAGAQPVSGPIKYDFADFLHTEQQLKNLFMQDPLLRSASHEAAVS